MTAQAANSQGIAPTSSQAALIQRHRDRIARLVPALAKLLQEDHRWVEDRPVGQQRYPPNHFKQPRVPTTLAVLGPRGSGKSTCMAHLIEKLIGDSKAVQEAKSPRLPHFLAVPQTVDCTLGPANVPLGLSALMRLRRALGMEPEPPAPWSHEGEEHADPRVKDEQEAFRIMREAYILSRRAAGQVLGGTSTSGAHFARQASEAASEALALPDRVADWLQQAARRVGPEIEGFILVLDDVDLAQDGALGLVHSLLDELHQPRLILILGADLPRLERRVAASFGHRAPQRQESSDSPIELGVVRDLLYKALPQRHREWLRPWEERERWTFPHRSAPQNLGNLLLQRGRQWGVAIRNPALLPEFPRGLENLWSALRGLDKGEEAASSTADTVATIEEYLAFLGEARRDHDLGRRIASRSASAWARYMIWAEPDKPVSNPQWDHMVTSALEGGPLLWLEAGMNDLPLPDDPSSAARWLELLLDLALTAGQLTPTELIHRSPRMRYLVDKAQIRTDFHRDEMGDQLRNARGSVMAKLTWTRFHVTLERHGTLPEEFDAQIGLDPLHEAIEERRNAWPAILAQGLYQQRSEVLNDRQWDYAKDGPPDDAQALLPRGVRPLIVFVDSLARAPWRLLSETPRRRSLRINTLLAAGLVRAAYIDALERVFDALLGRGIVKKTARHTPSDADRIWLDAMHDRAPMPIVEWTDAMVEDRFHALLEGVKLHRQLGAKDLPARQAKHTDWKFLFSPYNILVACLDAYTKAHAFKDLADPSRTQVD